MANFSGKLFNVSDSGGLARVAAFVAAAQGSPAAQQYVVATPTWVVNQNVMQLVILSAANPSGIGSTVGTSVDEIAYEVSGDGGAALIAAMNANFVGFGSPAVALTKVQAVVAANNFENLAICKVLQSN